MLDKKGKKIVLCGASNWSNVKVVENIRKLVANGACFVGIGDPSAYKNKSSYFVYQIYWCR